MFDIGFWEIALIAILALVVLGPKRLPEAARAAGYWVGRMRQFIANAKHDLDQEIQGGGLEEIRRLKEELDETRRYISQVAGQTGNDIAGIADDFGSMSENSIGASSAAPGITRKKKKARKKAAKKKAAKKSATRTADSGRKSTKKKTTKKKTASSRRKKSG